MNKLHVATLLSTSVIGLSAPAVAQDQTQTPAEAAAPDQVGPPADPTGANQDVVPGGEPEQAYQADTAVIVVEARRRDESVQDVPLVVNAVTAEAINELNLRDFKDIQTVVPGLTMTSNANGIGTTSSVRGVNFDVNASGAFGTIEYYLNDAPITSGAIFNAMYDIGQIEVLRGPQGTLRGRASPSGSITVAHRKPDLDEVGGYVQGTVNDIGGANVNGAAGAPIIPGVLAVRVAGLVSRGRADRIRSINNDADPYNRTKSARVFLRAEPTDWLNAEAVYQHIDIDSRTFSAVACFDEFASRITPAATARPCTVRIDPEDRLSVQRAPQFSESKFDIFTWKASAGFAGQRLYYVGLHVDQNINSNAPGDLAALVPFAFPETVTTNATKYDTHEVRLQNEERVFGMFDYVVGYFHLKQNSPSYLVTGRLTSPTPAGAAFSRTVRFANITEESYFGNLVAHLGEATEISGGARRIKVVNDSGLRSVCTSAATPGCAGGVIAPPITLANVPFTAMDIQDLVQSGTEFPLDIGSRFGIVNPRTFKKTIFSASAKHRFSDDLMVYANFGTSFRPGNTVVRIPANARTSATEVDFLFLPAETSKSYEIGFKSEFFNDTVKLNVAAYRQDFKNYPFRSSSGIPTLQFDSPATPLPTVGPGARISNVNFVAPVPVRVYGAEAELEWRPSDRFNLSANVSYSRGKIRNGNVPCLDLNGDGAPDTGGLPTGFTPLQFFNVVGTENVSVCQVNFRSSSASPWAGNLQGEYSLPVSDAAEGFVRTLVTYTGNSRNDEQNFFDDYDAYALVNLYAGVRDPDGAWEVTLYGKNIFEEETVLATTNGALITNAPGTLTSPYIGLGNPSFPALTAPREFGVTARFAFGSR